MTNNEKLPRRLYKYREFSDRTLDMLVTDRLYFADPSTFNDPLDTKPSLKTDLGITELKDTLVQLVEQRVQAEMAAAAKTLKYESQETDAHISDNVRWHVDQLIANIEYNSTNPEYKIDDPLQFLLGQYVKDELLKRNNKGVVSLAERAECPLMWSHYGDQHKGVCVGYSIPADTTDKPHKVNYGGSRLIAATEIAAMLDGKKEIDQSVENKIFLNKAPEWRYEHEWRLLNKIGLRDSQLEMDEIIFGMRCSVAVKYAIFKALEFRNGNIEFYEITSDQDNFDLYKCSLNTGELTASLPRNHRAIISCFKNLTLIPN